MDYHYSKLPEDGKPFSSKVKPLRYGLFNENEKVIGGPSMAATRGT